jgi:hypothetical protein
MRRRKIEPFTKELNEVVKSVTSALTLVLRTIKLQDSNLRKSIKVSTSKNGLTVSMPDYAIHVDKGRKSGKMPPIKDIMEWIREKRIKTAKGVSNRQMAFAIANSISKKGIRARPFIERFTGEMTDLIEQAIERRIDSELRF